VEDRVCVPVWLMMFDWMRFQVVVQHGMFFLCTMFHLYFTVLHLCSIILYLYFVALYFCSVVLYCILLYFILYSNVFYLYSVVLYLYFIVLYLCCYSSLSALYCTLFVFYYLFWFALY